MKTLTMTPYQARVLKLRLEGRDKGYGTAELRKLDAFLIGLESPIRDYEREVTAIIKEHASSNGLALREAIDGLNDRYAEPIKFNAEDDHFELIEKVWGEKEEWSGEEYNRRTVIAIDDALKEAKKDE